MLDVGAFLDKELANNATGRPTVLFVESEDPRIIETAIRLPRFARPVFLSSRERIEAIVRATMPHISEVRLAFAMQESAFCDYRKDSALREMLAHAALGLPEERRTVRSIEEARSWVNTPAGFGIMAAEQGHCDFVVGGAQHQPRVFLRPLLTTTQQDPVLCEIGVLVLPDEHPRNLFPHNVLVVSDVGINAVMTPEILAQIAVDTCSVTREVFPESVLAEIGGAIISHSRFGDDVHPVDIVHDAAQMIPRILDERCKTNPRYRSIVIRGQVKVADVLSSESDFDESAPELQSRHQKGVNVIITPDLDTGNLLFHWLASRYPSARSFTVLKGIGFRGVNLPMNVGIEHAILAVKATLVNVHRFGGWRRTPRATFFARPRILTLNPSSNSTTIGVFEGEETLFNINIRHSEADLARFDGRKTVEQLYYRKGLIEQALKDESIGLDSIDAISSCGGMVNPSTRGLFHVNDNMRRDLLSDNVIDHASNLGPLLAFEFVRDKTIPAFAVDPIVIDEVETRCRITGIKEIRRRPIYHALAQIASGHRYANENETFYENLNLIIAHMGYGISVAAHRKGRVVDANNALDGEGPIAPRVSGTLPVGDLVRLCFSGEFTQEQLLKMNRGRGGLYNLLDTDDFKEIDSRYTQGDPEVRLVFEAFCYYFAKSVCSFLPAFDGDSVDQILISGGIAHSKALVEQVTKACLPLKCGITVYAGENESYALARGALRVLEEREKAQTYT